MLTTQKEWKPVSSGILNKNGNKPFLWWVLSTPLLIASAIMILYVYISNYPFWAPSDSPTLAMSSAGWLFTLNTTEPKTPDPDLGFIRYGFGVWGWCEWGSSTSARTKPAKCFGGGAWKTSVDMGPGSTVDTIDLPVAITDRLSAAGISLILPVIISIWFAFLAAYTTRFKGPAQPPCLRITNPNGTKKGVGYAEWEELWNLCPQNRYRMGLLLRWFWIGFTLLIIEAIPLFIVVGIVYGAQGSYKAIRGVGYSAKIGTGTTLLIIAYCLQVWSMVIIWTQGLWRNRHAKYKYNMEKPS